MIELWFTGMWRRQTNVEISPWDSHSSRDIRGCQEILYITAQAWIKLWIRMSWTLKETGKPMEWKPNISSILWTQQLIHARMFVYRYLRLWFTDYFGPINALSGVHLHYFSSREMWLIQYEVPRVSILIAL